MHVSTHHQTSMPTNSNTRIWNHMQLLLPSPRHAILTNHTCQEERPLAVLCGDLHHHPKGTIHPIDLVRASITVVYVTLPQMRVLHLNRAHHPFPTTPHVAPISPLPPIPCTNGTNHGEPLDGQQTHRDGLPRVQSTAPTSNPSDSTLRTHRLEARTCLPADKKGPPTNPTIGPE